MKWDRPTITLVSVLSVAVILFAIRLWMLDTLVTAGPDLYTTQAEIKQLDIENQALKQSLWELESYQNISVEARKMGLTEDADKHLYYLK